jgi:hypothetical protein
MSLAGTLGRRGVRSHTELDGHGAYIPQTVGTLSDGAHNGGGLMAKMPIVEEYSPQPNCLLDKL